MTIKISPPKKNPNLRLKYLCLLDNVDMKNDSVKLGDYTLCKHTVEELVMLVRGRDDLPLSDEEKEQFEEWSCLTWAHYEEQADDCESWRKHGSESSDWDLHRHFFLRATAIARANRLKPFRRLIEALNVMKPSDGPTPACRIFMRPVGDVQTSVQVVSRYVDSYTALWDPGDEYVTQVLQGYLLEVQDGSRFETLLQELSAKNVSDGSYLILARHFFERADELLHVGAEGFELTDPLLAYDACIEALLVHESEKGSTETYLTRRFGSLIRMSYPLWRPGRGATGVPTPENFVRRVFLLRSKIAHGVWPVHEISDYLTRKSNEAIVDPRSPANPIPAGKYDEVFPNLIKRMGFSSWPNTDFLINVRESARLCLRYFLEKHHAGQSRDVILGDLDK